MDSTDLSGHYLTIMNATFHFYCGFSKEIGTTTINYIMCMSSVSFS